MFFSYTASLVVLSLALCGLWLVARDVWNWWCAPRLIQPPSISFLIVVQDLEREIEYCMRYLLQEVEEAATECDIVVVDRGSQDLTPDILERLSEDCPMLRLVRVSDAVRAVSAGMPLCRGSVVHVLDMVNRLTWREFMVAVCSLLRQSEREVLVKKKSLSR